MVILDLMMMTLTKYQKWLIKQNAIGILSAGIHFHHHDHENDDDDNNEACHIFKKKKTSEQNHLFFENVYCHLQPQTICLNLSLL